MAWLLAQGGRVEQCDETRQIASVKAKCQTVAATHRREHLCIALNLQILQPFPQKSIKYLCGLFLVLVDLLDIEDDRAVLAVT